MNETCGRVSRLPDGGTNLFQETKEKRRLAEERGIKIIDMSIGQPRGSALRSARKEAAKAILSRDERMHEYQDNGSPGVPDFAKCFAQYHIYCQLKGRTDIDFLPVPGIKSTLGLIPLACGSQNNYVLVGTTTDPGYPTPEVWCNYVMAESYALNINPNNGFRFDIASIWKDTDLLMINYPHNPSGQIATMEWWDKICAFCQENGIRIFNDAAYAGLSHLESHCALADTAINYPDLSWIEAYSASKLIGNATGWRIGAVAGSPDFIGDLKTINGNANSGPAAPMMAGVLYAIENDQKRIEAHKQTYRERIDLLVGILSPLGMKLAVTPGAGFFTLWMTPKTAFGKTIQDAEHFNNIMIEETGVVGVPFGPYIRYAVTNDIGAMRKEIAAAFQKANISY